MPDSQNSDQIKPAEDEQSNEGGIEDRRGSYYYDDCTGYEPYVEDSGEVDEDEEDD